MKNPAFCICKKQAQISFMVTADDQRLYFQYIGTTNPLFSKSEISSLLSSVVAQPGLCLTWLETLKMGFVMTWLVSKD